MGGRDRFGLSWTRIADDADLTNEILRAVDIIQYRLQIANLVTVNADEDDSILPEKALANLNLG